MDFLELINKCLVELNYKKVNAFNELIKNEHCKIKNIINVLNSEVCQYAKWNFLLRKVSLNLTAGMSEVENSLRGRISQLFVDGHEFNYHENVADIINGKLKGKNLYSLYNDKIIFSKVFDENKSVEVIYYTLDSAVDASGVEKLFLENSEDKSLVPMPYLEPIIVYGTCLRLKGNPQHIRFNYWLTMYKEALSNMVSRCSIDAGFSPSVKLHRV